MYGRTHLDETDPFVLEQIDRLEHHRAYTGGRDTERVEGGSGVGLVGAVQGAIEVDLLENICVKMFNSMRLDAACRNISGRHKELRDHCVVCLHIRGLSWFSKSVFCSAKSTPRTGEHY